MLGYNCTTDVIDRLCKYFGCQVSDLMEHISE
ncbi:helix-turn-helix domain-containing protein [Paraperlucidibaca wandonensis]|uniref:Helix-turn-helix domain-containing protein n=1 Tax=Paraperlucidibaca wandonensis TaxID=1268273 RepID=A0ABW3HE45_9GAMM